MTIEPGLPLTGERTLPGIPHENYWYRRHEVTYRAILPYCNNADILDAGSGEGYGGELLRTETEARVVALDRDERTVRHVRTAYPALLPVRGSLSALPFTDGTFDAVVGIRVIEQVWDQQRFVRECVRVLRPLGTLLLSSVNRLTAQFQRPQDNPFHTREFTADELVDLIDSWFYVTRVLAVCHGPRLREWEAEHGSLVAAQLAGPPQTWPDALRELVESVTVDDFALSPADADDALDILLVAARR